MLCTQSRQGRAQSLCTLVFVLVAVSVLLVSCIEGNREETEADRSAFGTYVDSLDSSLEGKWFTRMGVSSDADSLLSYLRRELPQNGLDSSAFFIPQIAEDLDIVHRLAFDSVGVSINELLPRLDNHLSKAFVSYSIGQRYGFVLPDKLLNSMDYKVGGGGHARLFDYEVKAPDSTEAERKLTASDRLDYLRDSQPKNYVYQALYRKMEKTTDKETRSKLAINMERCRWQIKHPEEHERRILVNIPSLQLWAIGADSVLNMRICCGARATKTPLLNSHIKYMQVNPDWIIPHNIVKSDVARHGGDSAYFARHRYYIVDRSGGDTLNPTEVTSAQMVSGNLRIGQKGGAGNSLGRIVFRFPNNFSVYLHDTNNRGAFNSDKRTLSHGCVRVQKPFELACFLLPDADAWLKDRIRISMDIQPQTERGRAYLREHHGPRPFRLISYQDVTPQVPLYIVYFTAYPNPSTGFVETWPDVYGYDQAVSNGMKSYLLK